MRCRGLQRAMPTSRPHPIRSFSRVLAYGGGASLKEIRLSSGFPVVLCFVVPARDVRPSAKPWASFSASRSGYPLVAPSRQGRGLLALIAHGLFSESGRSRSFPGDCTSTHPFVHPLAREHTVPQVTDLLRAYSLNETCARAPAGTTGGDTGTRARSSSGRGCGDQARSAIDARPPSEGVKAPPSFPSRRNTRSDRVVSRSTSAVAPSATSAGWPGTTSRCSAPLD